LRALDSGSQNIQSSQIEGDADKLLEQDDNLDAILKQLSEQYGEEYLEKLTPSQLYKLYKDHTSLPEKA